MTQDTAPFNFIPLPHVLIACTIASILTSVAVFQNKLMLVAIFYIAATCTCFILKRYQHLIVLLLCVFFSIQVYFKIQQTLYSFQQHQNFLKTPCIIKATILQKQTNYLDRDQATCLLQTTAIYNQQAGKLEHPLKITCLMPAKRALKLCEGQTITIFKAILQQPKIEDDFCSYLIKEGIWATTFITFEKILKTNHKNQSWFSKCSTKLYALLHANTINLFAPLFLGKREKSFDSIFIQHQSLYWGIAHHMARSGIHLVTLFGLFMTLFHYARIRHFYRYVVGALLMIFYFEISISSISFLRAFCMIMIQIIGKLHKFQYSSVHALALTTLIMVTHNPWYVLFLDFQLSFGITAVIIWLFQTKWSKTVAFQSKILLPS